MKYLPKILFFLVLLSQLVIAQTQEDYFNTALDNYLEGKYENALESLNKVTSPEFDVSSLKTQILEKLGRTEKSQEKTRTEPQVQNNQNTSDSSDDELYFEAVELFQNGEYAKAKELLLKINSDEIDIQPILDQIAELENKGEVIQSPQSVSSGSDEEKYFKALELYQNKEYLNALDILETISSKEIDTEPLKVQIKAFLKSKSLQPKQDEKVDITPFEYKIRKRQQPKKDKGRQVKKHGDSNDFKIIVPDSSSNILYTILIIFLALLFVALIIFWLKQRHVKTHESGLILYNKTTGKEFKVTKNLISLGRDDTCEIILDDEEASRRHAEIIFDPNTKSYSITDLNSTNGVIVNGKKISKVRLYNGDNIKIGNQLISVNLS